ncbi:MAG: two-component system response regulator [Deltaproteobacteria bacterium HGW-Deltaproteobacteria-19]|jgi:two-component system response regulator HydG|nr:MAG: two-component system response regulator [Deltaproteobacteria bacterium HGW-Deltaproteobacteria-19]
MKKSEHILVVDDDRAHRTMLKTLLGGWGYAVTEADDGAAAVAAVREEPFDLVLMDIRMINVSGIEALTEIKAFNPAIPVILMTAYASVETAVEALKKGAYDYLTKPLDFDELRLTIRRAMEHLRLAEENRLLRENIEGRYDRLNILGRSAAMTRLLETVVQIAPTEATVLVTGDSGTGKELIAGAIHHNSSRKNGPFVKINCAALTESLLESELFGHEKGAFTGADRRKEGKFRQADGGTLFLDEVSEMSLGMQVKLLRVLQEREITRVGGSDVLKVDVRIIAATNKDLRQEIGQGRFRDDLYYRLNVVNLAMPPLRERREDIPLLAQHFLVQFAEKNRKSIKGFTPRAMDGLLRYDWPGNVRELMNAVERGVVLARSEWLGVEDLALTLPDGAPSASAESPEEPGLAVEGTSLDELERVAILKTLEGAGGNKSEAARRLGITRRTLHKKLKQYGLM